MAVISPSIFAESQIARQLSNVYLNSDAALQLLAAASIVTAISSGLYTCTQSISGKSAADIQTLTNNLQALGYTFSISGTTLTINW